MNQARNIFLTFVTENQMEKINAEKLSESLMNELGIGWELLKIEKYFKFENSYKIELKKIVFESSEEKIIHLAISLTDKLLSPWLLYFDKDENSIELIYNKDKSSQIRQSEYKEIRWAHLQITS